jgi:uncharacterized protein
MVLRRCWNSAFDCGQSPANPLRFKGPTRQSRKNPGRDEPERVKNRIGSEGGQVNYYILMLIVFGGSMLAQWYLTSTYGRFSRIRNGRDLTGAEVARGILDSNGLQSVAVEMVPGQLSDHYDPIHKVVRLSEGNYSQPSLAALAVAAHEVGHAIQDAKAYAPLIVRARLAPVLSVSANLGQFALFIGIFMLATAPVFGRPLFLIGIAGLALTLIFHLVTLPVEFDASRRALVILEKDGYLTREENTGARSVLTAAAMTYVVAALGALATLAYYLGFLRRSDD